MHSFLQWNVEKAGQDQSNGTRFPHHTPATGPPSPYVILPLDTLGPSTAAFSSREPISRPCQTISRPRREARWLPVTVPVESRGLFLAGTPGTSQAQKGSCPGRRGLDLQLPLNLEARRRWLTGLRYRRLGGLPLQLHRLVPCPPSSASSPTRP